MSVISLCCYFLQKICFQETVSWQGRQGIDVIQGNRVVFKVQRAEIVFTHWTKHGGIVFINRENYMYRSRKV